MAIDTNGNIFVTGSFKGKIDLGGGVLSSTSASTTDVFIAKFDPEGNHLWSKRFGNAADQAGTAIATDGSGNVILAGNFAGSINFGGSPLNSAGKNDVFLAQFSASGAHLWSKGFGDPSDQLAAGVAVDASDNVILTGSMGGKVNFGGVPVQSAGSYDVFVAKFDSTGTHQWSERYGNLRSQIGYGVAVDGGGNVALIGKFAGSADFGCGAISSGSATLSDVFVAKLDPGGSCMWSKRYGSTGSSQVGTSIAVDSNGSVIVAGYFSGTIKFDTVSLSSAGEYDIFLAKLDGNNGDGQWSQKFGNGIAQRGSGVAVDAQDEIWLTGHFQGTVDFSVGTASTLKSAGGYDVVVAHYDANGAHVSSQRYGNNANQFGTGIAVNACSGPVVTGLVAGSIDFGEGPLNSAGSYDVFLAKILHD